MANEDINLSSLTEEQKAAIQEFLYKTYLGQKPDDNTQFVVPFIAMNDGQTPAQIKAITKGLYRDVQRSPFLRKTGTFNKNNAIEDIDITPLVYYGTLQQSKIAPTLENIDIKLYFREPKLTKVPSKTLEDGEYADTYIWRELPVGFHVYNNDTVYGYEWLVLQSNYTGTDGIYNLHMNIEDGIGACKFAGTQAPINLAGVQYKIVITAKNLWNREFSLIDSMPLLHSLKGSSDSLAPTVDAIKKYYAEAVETLKVVTRELFVNDPEDKPVLFAGKDGLIVYKNLTVGQIKNLEEYVMTLRSDLDEHTSTLVEDAAYDRNKKLLGPHGIVNKGFEGNIAAKTLDGLSISNGSQAISENIAGKYAYIPYVTNDNVIGLGTVVNYFKRGGGADPSAIYSRTFQDLPSQKTLNIIDVSKQDELARVLYSLSFGSSIFNAKLYRATDDGYLALKISEGNDQKGNVVLDIGGIVTDTIHFNGSNDNLTKDWVSYVSGASSIAYKIPISEFLNIKVKEALGDTLEPNTEFDADGNTVSTLDTENLESFDLEVAAKQFTEDGFNTVEAENALDKLGSALQALYELPLGTYTYKRGQEMYKEQIGIFVERVNQFRDKISKLRGTGEDNNGIPSKDNYLVHKRVKSIQSDNDKIIDFDQGLSTTDNSLDQGTNFNERVKNNAYTYTEDEIKSIAHYLDLMTSKKELAQEIRNTVGILLKAAKETQERLLDIETNIYGFDASTLPGSDSSRKKFVDAHIAKDLQQVLNNSPLLLGLNRLIRALCLEIYDTTDLESIDAEIRSVVGDSDTLKDKITVKSRMDKIDDLLSDLTNQASALTRYYTENIFSDESCHTYTDIYNFDETKQTITEKADIIEDESILDDLADDHTEAKDVDKGRTWKNLPAIEDVSSEAKQKVAFAQIATSTHKHSPKQDESGIVRVPETYTFEHKDVDKNGKETIRSWQALKLEKDEETGTYWPLFKTKAVAWENAKLERINKKLSEVTKDIYGVDDVTASLPNRTEVLRRNITNLVDDLYPNRSFSVEKQIDVGDKFSDIRLPFKKSNQQIPDENAVVKALDDEPEATEKHTSIVPYFDNELFSFSINSNLFKASNHKLTKDTFGVFKNYELLDSPINYLNNKQISIDLESGQVVFDTSKLVTDSKVFDPENYGTYANAYSRTDLLSNLIGVENCYPTDLLNSTIYDAFGINKNNLDILDYPAKEQSTTKTKLDAGSKIVAYNTQLATLSDSKSELTTNITNLEASKKILDKNFETVESNLAVAIQDLKDKVVVKLEAADKLSKESNRDFSKSTLESKIENLEQTISVLQANTETYEKEVANTQVTVDKLQLLLEKYKDFETEIGYRFSINDQLFNAQGFIAETEKENFKPIQHKSLRLPEEISEKHYENLKFVVDEKQQVWAVCSSTAKNPEYGIYAIELNTELLVLASKLHVKEAIPTALWTKLDSLEYIYSTEYSDSLNMYLTVLANDVVDDLVYNDVNYTVSSMKHLLTEQSTLLENYKSSYETNKTDLDEKVKELVKLNLDLKDLEAAEASHEELLETYQKELEDATGAADVAQETKDNLEEEYQTLFKNLQNTNQQLDALKATLDSVNYNANFIENQIKILEEVLDSPDDANFNIFPTYIEELKYLDSKKKVTDKNTEKENVVNSLSDASNLDYVLSRKQKSIQDRVTTLEAFADEVTKGFNLIDTTRNSPVGDVPKANIRFEQQDSLETLHALAESSSEHATSNLIFDLDLADAIAGCEAHNRSVFEIVKNSKKAKKSAYTINPVTGEGGYEIECCLALDPAYIAFEENPEKFRKEFAKDENAIVRIYVKYVDKIPTDTESKDYYHTIYLQKKISNAVDKLPTAQDFKIDDVLQGAAGWQNQSEYNMYRTMYKLFENMLSDTKEAPKEGSLRYLLFKSIYPKDSYYYSQRIDDNPAVKFGGTWSKINAEGIVVNSDKLKEIPALISQGTLTVGTNTVAWSGTSHAHSFNGSVSFDNGSLSGSCSGGTGYTAAGGGSNTFMPSVKLSGATETKYPIVNLYIWKRDT